VLRVGLTGGIASGKTAVSDLLREHGAVVIDADVLAREVVEAGTPGFDAVVAAFGPSVVGADGGLDRAALGRVVFADPDARRRLEAIVHPLVRARAAELEREAVARDPDAIVVHDIPLLAETRGADGFDAVIVVDVDPDVQLRRLVVRGMAEDDARARIAAQASREDRLAIATEVIDNNGILFGLDEQVAGVWARLSRRYGPLSDR
jgi:dephospho-CoA kinase